MVGGLLPLALSELIPARPNSGVSTANTCRINVTTPWQSIVYFCVDTICLTDGHCRRGTHRATDLNSSDCRYAEPVSAVRFVYVDVISIADARLRKIAVERRS